MAQTANIADLTISGLVHDLNNVLQTLSQAAGLLADDPQWEALSRTIQRCVDQGRGITNGLESAEQPAVSFETIANSAIAFATDWVATRSRPPIRFEQQIAPGIELRRMWAWERVLINLFLNAIHATPKGGTIRIEAQKHGSRLRIVVRDEGTGIAPHVLDEIFQPYVSTKDRPSGLGLHIVQTIVRESGGEISAVNRADRSGAVFTIEVPLEISTVRSATA
jgi:signal transduction histidine kinase